MTAPRPVAEGGTGNAKTEAALAAAGRRKRARLTILGNAPAVELLEKFGPWIGERADRDDVCKLYATKWAQIRSTINRYRAELTELGYDTTEQTFSRAAVLDLALLLRPTTSAMAGELAQAMGVIRRQPMEFQTPATSGGHVNRCKALITRASDLVADIRDIDPAEVWAGLDKLSRYELQGLVIAVATRDHGAEDDPTAWLVALSTTRCQPGTPGRGLGLLVPTKASVEAGGVPIGELDGEDHL